ncbi:MAG: cell wall metabolism sensor histidine kinase WalK [Clostridiales bacterium]|nr:cell wall metabolism sensor histidine kinase WalK [Clostridiales bacterium]
MRLVLILVLLILSVMIVVGTMLISRVTMFYLDDFRTQMETVFTQRMISELENSAEGSSVTDTAERLRDMLSAYAGPLGIDANRNFYILGDSGNYLSGSNESLGQSLKHTTNVIKAINGEVGSTVTVSNKYMDLAIPLTVGEENYIIYILDDKLELTSLNHMLLTIILQVVFFGLVFAVILSFFLSKTMTTPLENVTKGAKLLAAGDFKSTLPVSSDDEIGVLTQTFNNMAETLQSTLRTVEDEKNKLNTLFLHMTDGVAAFDGDGNIIHMNPAAEIMLSRRFSPELTNRDLFPELNFETENSDNQNGIEYKIGDRNLLIFPAPMASQDSRGGIMAVIHDVTEQHKLEIARREFVANVSHELRTPLTSIKSYTETLIDAPDLPPELSSKFLEVIDNEADRMARIVKDLLTLSRLDYGKLDLKVSIFSIDRMLKSVYDAMLFEAKNHEHELILHLSDSLPTIEGDRERIEQVVVNIVANSIKYTPHGGRISISAHSDGEYAIINVTDNGIGIPEEDIPRLFERFYRVDKARSRERGGTGLGLAIAGEIVRYHKGTIDVESKVDAGTSVTIRFPLQFKGMVNDK